MLVVSRRPAEEVVIGNDLVRITVLKVKGDKVRIGINAPKELAVHRKEVFERIEMNGHARPATDGRESDAQENDA